MSEHASTITGGDYERAGQASRTLKEQLKKIGVAPEVIRRAMIAAYEAEMNVVIHAHRGRLVARLDDNRLDVEVADEGPGIADIEQAMREGFSTAPSQARELGFGAGMGLPNIRRSADRFTIESTVGQGTTLRFAIQLRPLEASGVATNSIAARPERCTECLRCLHVCPTRAMRVRPGGPQVLDYLCVDCTSCIGECPAGTLTVAGTVGEVAASPDAVLVAPAAFLAQFSPQASPQRVLSALRELGFVDVRINESADAALRSAVLAHAQGEASGDRRPVISPVCPAIVNLIETRFAALIGHVAPFLSPMEAAREELTGRRAVFVTICPASRTLLQFGGGPARVDAVLPSDLYAALAPLLAGGQGPGRPIEDSRSGQDDPRVLQVTGMRHVINVLEEIENGTMREPMVLELFACDEGCFGSPLLREDPYVSRRNWQRAAAGPAVAVVEPPLARKIPLSPRSGLRLDSSMSRAIAKLAEIDRLVRRLPGKDCGLCGCPTCAALAEDVVLGRATLSTCRRLADGSEKTP